MTDSRIDYVVVKNTNWDFVKFQNDVKEYLDKGYNLAGGVQIVERWIFQAVYKAEPKLQYIDRD